ncbi:MAG: nuclear transport factor 2 family protein [Phycisphaerae bacterium]|nr:nuclear transport factor 2 family protein [Phycisphaerae bacterium]
MAKKNKHDDPAADPKKDKAAKKAEKAARKAEKKQKKVKKVKAKEVKTGKGHSPFEVGKTLVEMFNKGQFTEIEEMFWSPKVCSTEGYGVSMTWKGRKAVEAKNAEWMGTHKIHAASAEGPYVGATGFAVKFKMDVEETPSGKRQSMEEVGVYRIKNGKIIEEEFMYRV